MSIDFDVMLDELQGRESKGDNVTSVPTGHLGVTEAAANVAGVAFDPNMPEADARKVSAGYLKHLDTVFTKDMKGYAGSSRAVKKALLDTGYNLGPSIKSWSGLTNALQDPNASDSDKLFNILDSAKAEGKAVSGLAVRRADMYNTVADTPITDINVGANGEINYKDATGKTVFQYKVAGGTFTTATGKGIGDYSVTPPVRQDEAVVTGPAPTGVEPIEGSVPAKSFPAPTEAIIHEDVDIPADAPITAQPTVITPAQAVLGSYDRRFDSELKSATEESPSFLDTTTAVFRRHSVITNAIYGEPTSANVWKDDPKWTSDAIKQSYNKAIDSGVPAYLLENAVAGSVSEEHWNAYLSNIRTQQGAIDTIDRASGLSAVPAYILNEAGNPINWLGFTGRGLMALKSTVQGGKSLTGMAAARNAINSSAAPRLAEITAAVGASELALRNQQGELREWSEVITNVGSTLVFGAMLHGATTQLHSKALAKRLTNDVTDVSRIADGSMVAPDRQILSTLEHNMAIMNKSGSALAVKSGMTPEKAVLQIRSDIAARYNLPNEAATIDYIHAAEVQGPELRKRVDAIKKGLGSNLWISKQSDFMKLIDSDSPVVQKAALDMFESAVGYGGQTAQTSMANRFVQYTDDITSKFVPEYDEALKGFAKSKGAGPYVAHRTYSNAVREEFDGTVAEELHKRYANSKFGGSHELTSDSFVRSAADAHDKMSQNALARMSQAGVSGMDEVDWHSGWMSMKTDLNKVNRMLIDPKAGERIQMSLYENLKKNSGWQVNPKLLNTRSDPFRIAAKAYAKRLMARSTNVDQTSLDRMLGDIDINKLKQRLIDADVDDVTIDSVLEGVSLTKSKGIERGKPTIETKTRTGVAGEVTVKRNTFKGAHHRLPINPYDRYNGFALGDILDTRLQTVAEKYAHNVAGISVKSERGFRTAEEFDQMINAAIATDRKDGNTYRAKILNAANDMFSSRPLGGENSKLVQGILDYTSARALGGTGLASTVELANVLGAHQATAILQLQTFRTLRKMFNPNTTEGMANIKTHLDELREFGMGALAREHKVHMPNVRLELQDSASQGVVMTATANAQRALYKYSGNNLIRAKAHELTVGSMAVDLVKVADGKKGARWLTPARLADLGWDSKTFKNILDEVKRNKTSNPDGTYTLGLGDWAPETLQLYKDGLSRHVNTLTQRAFAGEEILAFKSPIMRLLFQFMQYPMTALGKQLGRSLNHMDAQAGMQFAWGLGLSMMQHHVRTYANAGKQAPEDRKKYIEENLSIERLANGTLSYMPQTPFFNLPYAAMVDGMNYGQEGYRPLSRSPSENVGASLSSLDAIGGIATAPFDMLNGEHDRGMDKLYNAMPLQSFPWLRPIYGKLKEEL